MAMGVMGVSYGLWTDPLNINGTVHTGTWNDTLVVDYGWINPAAEPDTNIYCLSVINTSPELPDPDQMILTIDNAKPSVSYNYDFHIDNDGTIPTVVQSIVVSAPDDLSVTVQGISKGMPIEPGESVYGTVSIQLKDNAVPGYDHLITVYFLTVKWNQYVP